MTSGGRCGRRGYDWTTLIFQTVFCATAATIVSGAMAEAHQVLGLLHLFHGHIGGDLPDLRSLDLGRGWLAELGFHDFAGSTGVHMVGGVAALVGAAILGPRIGKYNKDGKARAIPGHSLTLGALGVFILWFCWFGFNGGSTVARLSNGAANPRRAFSSPPTWRRRCRQSRLCASPGCAKKPDVSMTLNGSLAGLVAITAGCDTVSPVGAAIIGILRALVVVFGIGSSTKLKMDDPLARWAHSRPVRRDRHADDRPIGYSPTVRTTWRRSALFYGGAGTLAIRRARHGLCGDRVGRGHDDRGVQIIKHDRPRVQKAEEIMGLGQARSTACPPPMRTFMPVVPSVLGTKAAQGPDPGEGGACSRGRARLRRWPVSWDYIREASSSGHKWSKVVILAKQSKFEAVKNAMNEIGIAGMTVTPIGRLRHAEGAPEYYRGAEVT